MCSWPCVAQHRYMMLLPICMLERYIHRRQARWFIPVSIKYSCLLNAIWRTFLRSLARGGFIASDIAWEARSLRLLLNGWQRNVLASPFCIHLVVRESETLILPNILRLT